jgi:hypothetical protein
MAKKSIIKKRNATYIPSATLAAKIKGIVVPKTASTTESLPPITGCLPTGSCVLVELLTTQELQGTYLYVPEDAKGGGECPQAYVLNIGPKVPADIGFKIGDRVMLQGTGANPVPDFRGGNSRKMNLVEPHLIRAVLVEG